MGGMLSDSSLKVGLAGGLLVPRAPLTACLGQRGPWSWFSRWLATPPGRSFPMAHSCCTLPSVSTRRCHLLPWGLLKYAGTAYITCAFPRDLCILINTVLTSVVLKIGTVQDLVVWWLRIHLATQGIWVGSFVQEDPVCRGATKPMSPSY